MYCNHNWSVKIMLFCLVRLILFNYDHLLCAILCNNVFHVTGPGVDLVNRIVRNVPVMTLSNVIKH